MLYKEAYKEVDKRHGPIMRMLLLLLVTVVLLLTACGGGGNSGGSDSGNSEEDKQVGSEIPTEMPTNVSLEIIPAGDSFNITVENYSSFPENIVGINITAIVGNNTVSQLIPLVNMSMSSGVFILTNLTSGQRYHFLVAVINDDGSESPILMDFIESENQEDHNNGGILLGANWDGDERADDDSKEDDDDNDNIKDNNDLCPRGIIGWQSDEMKDRDEDGCRDTDEDIDDDGDGLIEISTPTELDAVRYRLDGRGRKLTADAPLDSKGCGGRMNITRCHGYELVNNISLTKYIEETYPGVGWLPIGRTRGCINLFSVFPAIFEGNHFVISGLSINRPSNSCMGLFSYLGSRGQVHRLGIEADRIHGSWYTGTLAGRSEGIINDSYAIVTSLSGGNNYYIGGLIGYGQAAHIEGSYVIVGSLHGRENIGGLVGRCFSCKLSSSYAIVDSLTGRENIGGLVGWAGTEYESTRQVDIRSSYAIVNSLNGDRNIGGVAGRIGGGSVESSYAIFNTSHGDHYVGGLVGDTYLTTVIASYAMFNKLVSNSSVDDNGGGGLIGQASASEVISSYVIANSLEGDGLVGGFIGNSTEFSVNSSYGVFGSLVRTANLNIDTLIGNYSSTTISNSYWNNETTNLKSGTLGEAKSGSELTIPQDYGGIYNLWDDGVDVDGGGVDNITIYCDRDLSGAIEPPERENDNKIWDFVGGYPAIRCTPNNPPAAQRAWWSLNDEGEPMLDNERLDEVLDSYFP